MNPGALVTFSSHQEFANVLIILSLFGKIYKEVNNNPHRLAAAGSTGEICRHLPLSVMEFGSPATYSAIHPLLNVIDWGKTGVINSTSRKVIPTHHISQLLRGDTTPDWQREGAR